MIKNDAMNKETCKERIEQKIDEFTKKVQSGTENPENFLTMSEIELMWSELRKDTDKIYTELLSNTLSQINESELIRKKNRISTKRNRIKNKQTM